VGAAGKARLPWFLVIQGRGASGLGRARGAPELMKNEECLPSPAARPREGERRIVSFKTTLFCSAQNSRPLFFYIYIYIYVYIVFTYFICRDTQKWVTTGSVIVYWYLVWLVAMMLGHCVLLRVSNIVRVGRSNFTIGLPIRSE
jgi:hypothetical protein